MRKLSIILILLLIGCKTSTIRDIDYTFIKYVEAFERATDGSEWGRYISVQFDAKMPWGVAGMANGMGNDDAVFIWISKPIWNKLTKNQREWLIWHELAHDTYDIQHGEALIMSRSIPGEVSDLILARAKYELINLINGKRH